MPPVDGDANNLDSVVVGSPGSAPGPLRKGGRFAKRAGSSEVGSNSPAKSDGDVGAKSGFIEPASAEPAIAAGKPAARKRGRPAGSGSKAKPAKSRDEIKSGVSARLDLDQLAAQAAEAKTQDIFDFHLMIAATSGNPALALTREEAYALALAIAKMEQEFEVSVPRKWAVVGMLLFTAQRIYFPRLKSVSVRRTMQKAETAKASPFHFEGRPASPQDANKVAPFRRPGENITDIAGRDPGAIIIPTGTPDGGKINFGQP
jgi:hypothetical protein